MGVAAKLFHNSENRENTLSYRVRPSDEQFEEQQERWNDLADYLKGRMKEELGKPISSWLQGSYKFGTQVRPAGPNDEFDIDLGVYVEWSGAAEDGEHGPLEIKNCVQGILEEYAADEANEASETTAPKARCNRIRFTEDFHIDVPSYHLDRGADARDLATQEGTWELSDPKAIYVWWKDQFEDSERDRARRLARYLKMWALLHFEEDCARPSSILLTVLVADALAILDSDELTGDDEYLGGVLAEIVNRLSSSSNVANPVNTREDLNRLSYDDFSNFKDRLDELQSIAERALGAADEFEAADIWAEAFNHFFPFPEEEEVSKTADHALAVIRHDPDVEIPRLQERDIGAASIVLDLFQEGATSLSKWSILVVYLRVQQ